MSALEKLKAHLSKPFDENDPKKDGYVSGYVLYQEVILENLMKVFKVSSKEELMKAIYAKFALSPKEEVDKMVEALLDPHAFEKTLDK